MFECFKGILVFPGILMASGVAEFLKNLFSSSGLSKFEVYGKVDEGRMSVISRARDKRTMRTCFLKIYKTDCIRIRSAIRRKQPDIDEILLSIDHPNVMAVYEFGSSRDQEYTAIEAIDGVALGALAREGKLSFEDSLRIFAGVADGLAYLHEEKNLIHRDLNPFNVVVTSAMVPKIIDLDFAIVAANDTAGMYRRSGTVAYLSPEQVRGQHLDHRVDIYALGITMYEVITGVNPYWDRFEETEQQRIDRTQYNHLSLIPDPPSSLRSECSPELDDLFLGCLKISRDERVQTAREISERLIAMVGEPEPVKDESANEMER